MYSSSPNLIKHFVPMSFSKQSIDYKKSPRKQTVSAHQENPLMNMKLRTINQKPKDYVLIFKNKSCKEFSPRKKISYSPIIGNIYKKQKNDGREYEDYQLISRSPTTRYNSYQQTKRSLQETGNFELIRPRNVSTAIESQRMTKKLKSSSTSRVSHQSVKNSDVRKLIHSYTSAKDKQTPKTSANSLTKGRIIKSAQRKLLIIKEADNFQTHMKGNGLQQFHDESVPLKFRVKGKRAPKEETVDHFKKLCMDPHFSLVQKII